MARGNGTQQRAAVASLRHARAPRAPAASVAVDPDSLPVAKAVRQVLLDAEFVAREKLLEPEYRDSPRPYAGHCYVACEAHYHLSGGEASGLKPCRVKLRERSGTLPAGTRHWWLVDSAGVRVDLTGEQFEHEFPYHLGVNGGFLTREPSKRAQKVIDRVRQLNPRLT